MFLKLFSFSKVEKSPKIIEDKLNEFLKDNSFKFACQSESTSSGKFHISLYCEPKKGKVLAKVFKHTNSKQMEASINEFLETGVTLKFSSQTSASSTIYVVVFYELGKANDKSTKDQD